MSDTNLKMLRCPVCDIEYPSVQGGCPKHSTLVDLPQQGERIVAEKYKLIREVGKGGMGSVFETRHVFTNKLLAIKILHKKMTSDLKLVARFRREAMAAGSLNHPNCVQVLDFGEDRDGTFFIVMEFIDGKGIGDELKSKGPMSVERCAHIGIQILQALEAAHEKGILHRDLKPQNIMLTQKPGRKDFAKVVDFGIAKFVDNNPADQVALTVPGTIFGTPEYMSPEQARGETLDRRSDVYSASVVMWQMLLGRSPFRGKSVSKTLANIFSKTPDSPRKERPLAQIPQEFEDLLKLGMQRDREKRFSSAQAMASALKSFTKAPHTYAAPAVVPAPGFSAKGEPLATQSAPVVVIDERNTASFAPNAVKDTVILPAIEPALALEPGPGEETKEIVAASPAQNDRPLRLVEPTSESMQLELSAFKKERRQKLLFALIGLFTLLLIILLFAFAVVYLRKENSHGAPESSTTHEQQAPQLQVARLANSAAFSRSLYAQRKGDSKAALEHLLDAVKEDPKNPESHFHLGVAAIQNERLDLALKHFDEAERLAPDYSAQIVQWRELVDKKRGQK